MMSWIWLLIGVLVAGGMGLTGAGGAILSIPLFVHVLDLPFSSATIYSLICVASGALLNIALQRKSVDFRAVFWLVVGTIPSVTLAVLVKPYLPDSVLRASFGIACALSLWETLRKKADKPVPSPESVVSPKGFIITGLVLGILVTWTGLGGGILMVPILTRSFGFPYARAVPTSLVMSALGSLYALGAQYVHGFPLELNQSVLWMILGLTVNSMFIKFLISYVPKEKMELLRRRVFITLLISAIVSSLF